MPTTALSPTSLHLSSYQPLREGQTIVAWVGDGVQPLQWHLIPLGQGKAGADAILDLSPLGATPTAQWIAKPGKWRLVASSTSRDLCTHMEFWIYPADQAPRLAQELAQAEDPHSVQGGLSRVLELLESFPQESNDPAARTFKESLQEQQGRLEAVIQAVAGQSRYPIWCDDPNRRAFVSVGPNGWHLVDWSDSSLASGVALSLEPGSGGAREALMSLLDQWKSTILQGRLRGCLAYPEQPEDPATAWTVHSFELAGGAGPPAASPVDTGIWHRALAKSLVAVPSLSMVRLVAGKSPVEEGLELWRRGSAKLDLLRDQFGTSGGVLETLGIGSSRPLARGALLTGSGKDAGKTFRCWVKEGDDVLDLLLVDPELEASFTSLLEGRTLPTPERLSWFLAEVGTALETRRMLWHQHACDGGKLEDHLQDDDKHLQASQLASVAGHTKNRIHKVVVGSWSTGFQTESDHSEIRPLHDPSNGKGHLAIRLLNDWGDPLPSQSVKILRGGAVVHEVTLKDGCACQGDLPYGCYELEVGHEGHIHRFSAAWLPGDLQEAIQTCHISHPEPKA